MGKKGTKRKTRWRVLPIGGEDGCNGVCSNNEDEADGDRDSASPLNNSTTTGTSYARASAQQRMPRTKPTTTSSRGGSYNYRHRSYYQQPHDSNQPLVTAEKKTFNEEEYTKITTPRQDVLFKKGYLGRKRPTAAPTADTTANGNSSSNPDNCAADVANGNVNVNGAVEQNGEPIENDQTASSDMLSPVEEQPQYIYATNGYVDQSGGPPPGLYYINGSGYELYDPYSGNVTVVVGPAPHYGGPGGGPPVLAAVPCQPLPLQPLEWFNPAFLPYVTAPCHNGLATARDRRKRYSTDSQNCSPQSSESTEPPGSPQECDMEATQVGEPPGQAIYTQAPAYVYPGYMFGPPMYNVNGVTVQGAPTQPPICDVTSSNKRRKKKKRRRRRRGAEDGCSEESSSDEKELEEPMSVTSQESSSQEIESDSKQSTTLNNDSSTSSPLSSCQTLTPTDRTDAASTIPAAADSAAASPAQLNAFDSEISIKEIPPLVNTQQSSLGQETISAPSASKQDRKDTYSDHSTCNFKPVVKEIEEQFIQEFSKQSMQITKDSSEDLNSTQLLKDQTETEEVDLLSNQLEPLVNNQDTPCVFTIHHSANHSTSETQSESNGTVTSRVSENTTQETESGVQCNGDITSSLSNESINKTEETAKPLKQKKTGKQANVKHKKNSKGKEEKQKRPKTSVANSNIDTTLKRESKKKDDVINVGPYENEIVTECITVNVLTHHTSPINSIPSEITTEVATLAEIDSPTQEAENTNSSQEEDLNTLLNGLDDKSQISNFEAKDNSVAEMDGNENKSISADEYTHAGRSGHGTGNGNGNGKPDLFPDFKSSCPEPPTKPVRKEKRKSSPINALPPDQHLSDASTKLSITAKSLQLPQISLRPDAPKTEAKSLHEVSLSQQLKGTADILESITAALTTEPPITKTLKATVHKDYLVSQEAEPSRENPANIAEPAPVEKATEQNPHEDISGQTTAVSMKGETDLNKLKHQHEKLKPFVATSSQEESEVKNKAVLKDQRSEDSSQSKEVEDEVQPPVPPPRGKKLYALKHKLTELSQTARWDLEGGNVTDESSGDSTTSSTTHESEESVIELLSSTHTSPDDRPKQDLSSDEEEDIIFRVKKSEGKVELMDIKSIPPDKSHVFTPSISGPSLQDSSQISDQDEPTASKTPPTPSEANVSLKYAEMYADELSNIIISEAISESSKKRMCLPITEAVTRWLRCQSPEVLSLPPPEDETESEVSSEEQESDERAEETGNQKQLTGQKNVFCNPLPVPLLEDCGHLSVNSDVNHSGYNNGTGRRVALNDFQYLKLENENIVSDKNDNNRNTVSISTEGDKRLISGYSDNVCISSIKGYCDPLTSVTNSDCGKHECQCQIHGESVLTQCPKRVACNINCNSQHANCSVNISDTDRDVFNHRNIGMDTMKDALQSRICLTNAKENSFQNISQHVCDIATSSSEPTITNPNSTSHRLEENVLNRRKLKNINNKESIFEKSKSNLLREDDECSSNSEETLECEWDLWDCNPAKLPSVLTTPKNQTPVEEILAKTPDDFCSHMCDPTVSVAKYYSLGALQKKSVKDEDETDSTDSNDEEVDALKHFQHELEDDDGLHTAPLLSTAGTGNLDKKSNEELERNNIYGNPGIYKSHYGESCSVSNSGIQCQEEAHRCRNMYNATLSQRAQAAHLFHKKSSVLVSKLKGDGPFPCGGICCILQ